MVSISLPLVRGKIGLKMYLPFSETKDKKKNGDIVEMKSITFTLCSIIPLKNRPTFV